MRCGPVGSLYLEFFLGFPTWAELQFSASSSGDVHNNFPTYRHVIVYDHDDGLAVFEVRHSDMLAHRYTIRDSDGAFGPAYTRPHSCYADPRSPYRTMLAVAERPCRAAHRID